MGYMEELAEFIENGSASLKDSLNNDPELLKQVETIDNKMMSELDILRSKAESLNGVDEAERIQIVEDIKKAVETLKSTYDNEYINLLIDTKQRYQAETESKKKKIADLEKQLRWYLAMDDREKAGRKIHVPVAPERNTRSVVEVQIVI